MKKIIACFICLFWGLVCFARQTNMANKEPVDFSQLLNHLEQNKYYRLNTKPDTIRLPLIHSDKDYKIELSDNPVAFDIEAIVLQNPVDDKFPISFSVIYQDRLVSLFEPGVFVCHSITSLGRDIEFENKINTREFKYHWLVEDNLVGFSDDRYYIFEPDNGWSEYDLPLPIKEQPVLFDDDSYICFRDCFGEWGGTIYFYDKRTRKIHYTEATCANSVLKDNNNYFVLSHLGHMVGITKLKEIADPAELPVADPESINKTVDEQALGYTDKSKASQVIFDYHGIQIFSSFIYDRRTVYMVYWRDATFLAEIEGDRIKIVNPLFNGGLYTHDPVTRSYGDAILMNLDFYGIGRYREISGIIIQNNKLIKFDWNQRHN